jgi:hypothetical protein
MNCLEERILNGEKIQMERDGEVIHVFHKYGVFVVQRVGFGLLCERDFSDIKWIVDEFKELEEVKWN